MATHDYNLANQSGQSFRSDLNNALAAIVSNNSSSTAPATTFAHQIWVDTTANVIKQRNAANDAWVELWRIDGGFNAKTFSSNVTLNAQSDLRFADSDSSNWVAFQAPATVSSNVTWTLPASDGTADQALTTNGSGVLSWADAGGVQDNITEGNTSAEVVDTGSDGHFKVVTEGTEALRVDASQRLLVGTSTARSNFFNTTLTAALQIEGTNNNTSTLSCVTNSTTSDPIITLGRSRGTSVGSNTVVSSGDTLGRLIFQGNDGTEFVQAAAIGCDSDGTPGANDMPGRLVFSTTADGASSPTERFRIGSAGQLGIGGATYGTSGQVLTSQGSGSAPQWASVSAGYTSAGTAVGMTGNNNLTISGIPTSARQIVITLINAGPPTSQENDWLLLRVGTTSGVISSTSYTWNTSGGTSVNYSNGQAHIRISGSWNNASNARDNGTIILSQFDANNWNTMSLMGDVVRGDSICQGTGTVGVNGLGANLDRIFLFTGSGNNWTGGVVNLQYI